MLKKLLNFALGIAVFPFALMFFLNKMFYGFISEYVKALFSTFKTAA